MRLDLFFLSSVQVGKKHSNVEKQAFQSFGLTNQSSQGSKRHCGGHSGIGNHPFRERPLLSSSVAEDGACQSRPHLMKANATA